MRAWFRCLRAHTGKSATGLCWQCFRSVLNWYRNWAGPLSLCSRDIIGPALVIVAIVVWRRLISLQRFKIVRVPFTQVFSWKSAQKWHEFPGFADHGNAWIPIDFDRFSKTLRFQKHSFYEIIKALDTKWRFLLRKRYTGGRFRTPKTITCIAFAKQKTSLGLTVLTISRKSTNLKT